MKKTIRTSIGPDWNSSELLFISRYRNGIGVSFKGFKFPEMNDTHLLFGIARFKKDKQFMKKHPYRDVIKHLLQQERIKRGL